MEITISYSSREGRYSFSRPNVEAELEALTGPVDRGAWAHAVGQAYKAGQPVTVEALAAKITEAQQALLRAKAKKGIRTVRCDCGHEVDSRLVMSASRGTACPDCYDDMSE